MDALRAYWDFDDLDATARRFRALRAEALTQLARVEGLRERFDEGDRLLDEAAQEDDARVRIRVDLERGRLRRSSGDKAAALPLFESAFAAALEAGEDWLAGDAAHMCALAARDWDGMLAWTRRGIELAEASEAAAYWAGPLLNNLGWEYFEAGEHEERARRLRARARRAGARAGQARRDRDRALRRCARRSSRSIARWRRRSSSSGASPSRRPPITICTRSSQWHIPRSGGTPRRRSRRLIVERLAGRRGRVGSRHVLRARLRPADPGHPRRRRLARRPRARVGGRDGLRRVRRDARRAGPHRHRHPSRRPRALPLLRGARAALCRAGLSRGRVRLLRPHGRRCEA